MTAMNSYTFGPTPSRTTTFRSTAERRRILLRLSLLLNAVFLGLCLYVVSTPADPDASSALKHSEERRDLIYHGGDPQHVFVSAPAGAAEVYDHAEETVAVPVPIPDAFQACTICTAGPVGKKLCDEFGPEAMNRLVAYSGTNHRLRRSLAKMRAGKPFTMAVVGGSVSAGHGLEDEVDGDLYSARNMHRLFFEHLNRLFPAQGSVLRQPSDGMGNGFVNGAQPGRGCDYFSMCSHLHVPEEADFVVVELAINDPPDMYSAETFELLLRSLLEYKNSPAVLIFNVYALMFDRIALGGDINHGVSQFYDVATLSTRNALLPLAMQDRSKILEWFVIEYNTTPNPDTLSGVDLRHFSPYMHRVSADMMMAYVELQLCEMDKLEARAGPNWDIDDLYPLDPLPTSLLMAKYDPVAAVPRLQPFCMATNSKEYPLRPRSNNGWRTWSWKDKKYLVANKPGATVTFDVSTTQGNIILYYLRSYQYGLGNLECLIDSPGFENTRKVLPGYWTEPYNIGRTETWSGLEPGNYRLKCTLLAETYDPEGRTEFRLISLMSI